MKRKLLFLSTCAFIALSGLSGCSNNPNNSLSEGDFLEDTFDKDGKLEISFFGIDLDSLQSQTEDTKLIINFIENKFQVKFKYINGNASGWETVLNQYIGGGDVPDVFFHEVGQPAYSNWRDDDYLFDYGQYLDEYPNLKKAFNRYDEKSMKKFLGGEYYGYPIVMDDLTDSDIVNQHGMYYRRDWYENLKAKNFNPKSGRKLVDPEDPSFNYLNFYDLCDGFTNGDPDNNGVNDTYAYALTKDGGAYWFYPILSMFGVTYDGWHYSASEDKWLPDCTSDNMKQALDFMADMYDQGFIAQNYATTLTQTMMKNEFVNGVAGMMSFNTNYNIGEGILELMEQYETSTKKVKDICRCMPIITGVDGTKRMYGYSNKYGFRSISNLASINKKKKIMSIMDWMLTDEGMTLLNYGIKDKHYKVENGKIVSLLGKNVNGLEKSLYDSDVAPGVYRIKGLVSWSTLIPTTIKHYEEQMQLIKAWDKQYLVANPLQYCSVDTDYALIISQLTDSISSCYQSIVNKSNKETRDSTWNDFVNNYNKKGASYITAMNMSAEEIGVEKK